jgi:hypothetical protein
LPSNEFVQCRKRMAKLNYEVRSVVGVIPHFFSRERAITLNLLYRLVAQKGGRMSVTGRQKLNVGRRMLLI